VHAASSRITITSGMSDHTATAQAHPNIAFIKYWGNRDDVLRLPSNGSISMNLDGLFTRTTVSFQPSLGYDELIINERGVTGRALQRVSAFLDLVREAAKLEMHAEVVSDNNFPSRVGISSSPPRDAVTKLMGTSQWRCVPSRSKMGW